MSFCFRMFRQHEGTATAAILTTNPDFPSLAPTRGLRLRIENVQIISVKLSKHLFPPSLIKNLLQIAGFTFRISMTSKFYKIELKLQPILEYLVNVSEFSFHWRIYSLLLFPSLRSSVGLRSWIPPPCLPRGQHSMARGPAATLCCEESFLRTL